MRSAAAPAGRAGGADGGARVEQVVEPALRAHGAVDEVGGERAVAVARGGVAAASPAGAHVRVRAVLDAHQRVERDDAAPWLTSRTVRVAPGAARAATRSLDHAAPCPRAAPRASSRPIRRRPTSARASTLARSPSTVVHAPGRGLPARTTRSSSRAAGSQSSRNSSTVSFSAYVGSPACGSGVGRRELRERVDEQVGAELDEPRAQLARGLVVADRRGRTRRTPARCRGPPRAAMMHTPVSASPARIAALHRAPRRASAAAARSAG